MILEVISFIFDDIIKTKQKNNLNIFGHLKKNGFRPFLRMKPFMSPVKYKLIWVQ